MVQGCLLVPVNDGPLCVECGDLSHAREGGEEEGAEKVKLSTFSCGIQTQRNAYKKRVPPREKKAPVVDGEFKKTVPIIIAWKMYELQPSEYNYNGKIEETHIS